MKRAIHAAEIGKFNNLMLGFYWLLMNKISVNLNKKNYVMNARPIYKNHYKLNCLRSGDSR
jgi:hypothetical protein